MKRQQVDPLALGGVEGRGDELPGGANIGVDKAEPRAPRRQRAAPAGMRFSNPTVGKGAGGDQLDRAAALDLPLDRRGGAVF